MTRQLQHAPQLTPEQLRARNRNYQSKWREANQEKRNEYQRAYRKANLERVREYERQHRARRANKEKQLAATSS